MLKLLDSSMHVKTAKLDIHENPVKIVCDHFRLYNYTVTEDHVVATFIRHDPITKTDLQPLTQFFIHGAALEYLKTPKVHEVNRKYGAFRESDIEECIATIGYFPGADFKGRLELV